MHIEEEDGSGDPWGYSFVTWRGFSFRNIYDEELPMDHESKLNGSQTGRTVYDDMEEEDDDEEEGVETFQDEELVEAENGRLQRRLLLCFICLFGTCANVGLGIGMFFVGKKISPHKVVGIATKHPTSTPTMAPSAASKADSLPVEEELPLNTTCYVCGSSEYTISKPNTILLLQSFQDLPEITTCSDLDHIGRIDGSISPDECALLKSETKIFQQCGCSNSHNETGADELIVKDKSSELNFPSCLICGSGKMNNPSATVSDPVSWGLLENATCENLNTVGLTGYIEPQACSDIQSSKEIMETCCLASHTTTIPTDSKSVQFPPCFLCGSEKDEISNPDLVLSLPTVLGYPENTTCARINNVGLEGKIRPEDCSIIQSEEKKTKQCGCSNFFDV